MFELKARDACGRIGVLETPHGKIETPAILPVINPNLQTIPVSEITRDFSAKAIITNSYIIFRDERLREKALKSGLHELVSFDGPIMTDSGAYQLFVYGDVEVSNRQIIDFQARIGTDIGVMLDIPVYGPYSKVRKGVDTTIERAKEWAKIREESAQVRKMLWAGPIQGASHKSLLLRSCKAMRALPFDVHPIGTVVPSLIKYDYRTVVDQLVTAKMSLPQNRPIHAFGAGHPMLFSLLVALGADLFDSASYALYAKDKRYMTETGTKHMEELKTLPCTCPVCCSHTPKELEQDTALIARHNLYVTMREMETVKQAIYDGRLWELAEQRIRAHPAMLEAYRHAAKYVKFTERFEPVTKNKAPLYTGPESFGRPQTYRFAERMRKRYSPPKAGRCLILDSFERFAKPTDKTHVCIVREPFGVVPAELLNVFPVGQAVSTSPDVRDRESEENVKESVNQYVKKNGKSYGKIIQVKSLAEFGKQMRAARTRKEKSVPMLEVAATLDYQFGKGARKMLPKDAEVEISKVTGRIRRVYSGKGTGKGSGKELLGTMRAEDGLFIPGALGARLLKKALRKPRYRVVVNKDSEPFVREGKSVFSKFVVDADESIRPGDIVLIVNRNDELLGVGDAMLNREEMRDFKCGVAVKTRLGNEKE